MAKLATRGLGLSLLAVAAITTTPALAYRTGEDSPTLAGRGKVAWSSNDVSFVVSETELPANLSKADVEAALSDALSAWAAPECSPMQPTFAGWTKDAPVARDGVNTIAWVTDWKARGFPADAPGNTVMQYHGVDGRWDIAEADVYLDGSGTSWSTAEGKDTSVRAALTHELGHALGLLHPCEDGGADGAPDCADASAAEKATTMYPFYSQGQESLEDDDIAGLCYLYPNDMGPCAACDAATEMCVDGACRALCAGSVCEAGEICGAWGCVAKGGCTERDCRGEHCKTDAQCGPLAVCQDGICGSGKTAWGSACKANSDCEFGACVTAVCQPICVVDTDCGVFGSCKASDDGKATGCISSSQYPEGATCASGEDCESRACVSTSQQRSCTSRCKASSECPAQWKCEEVDGSEVCVPPTYEPGGGCSVGSERSSSAFAGALLLGIGSVLRRRRRKARR